MQPSDRAGGVMPRRTFLEVSGLTVAGLFVAPAVRSATRDAGSPTPATAAAPARDMIEDAAAAPDYDPERIFRYVADEVVYEPYAGVLRGALGTLESRAGNAADKSLLLAALLTAAQVPTRFVIGTLDDATADALRTAWEAELPVIQERAVAVMQQRAPVPALPVVGSGSPAPSAAPLPPGRCAVQ